MTTKKKTATGKGEVKKLKLKKDTIKDLDVKSRANEVKGGRRPVTKTCAGCATGDTCLLCS